MGTSCSCPLEILWSMEETIAFTCLTLLHGELVSEAWLMLLLGFSLGKERIMPPLLMPGYAVGPQSRFASLCWCKMMSELPALPHFLWTWGMMWTLCTAIINTTVLNFLNYSRICYPFTSVFGLSLVSKWLMLGGIKITWPQHETYELNPKCIDKDNVVMMMITVVQNQDSETSWSKLLLCDQLYYPYWRMQRFFQMKTWSTHN